MPFYIITEGETQVEQIFAGRTKEEAVQNARVMINCWPEYEELEDDEIIEAAEQGRMEFDLVEIKEDWPGSDCPKRQLIEIYEKYYTGLY